MARWEQVSEDVVGQDVDASVCEIMEETDMATKQEDTAIAMQDVQGFFEEAVEVVKFASQERDLELQDSGPVMTIHIDGRFLSRKAMKSVLVASWTGSNREPKSAVLPRVPHILASPVQKAKYPRSSLVEGPGCWEW